MIVPTHIIAKRLLTKERNILYNTFQQNFNTNELNRLRKEQSKRFMIQVKSENNRRCYLINNIDYPYKMLNNHEQIGLQTNKKNQKNIKKTSYKDVKLKSLFDYDNFMLLQNR